MKWQQGSYRLEGKHIRQWVLRYTVVEIDSNGDRKNVQKSRRLGTIQQLPTLKAAKKAGKPFIDEANDASRGPQHKITIQQASERWLKNVVAMYKPSSRASTKSNLNKILATFGPLDCSAVDADKLQTWSAALKARAFEPKTISNYFRTFKMFWTYLRICKYVTGNPFELLRMPTINHKKLQPCFTLEQVRSILNQANVEPYATMFHILAETGMRGGEVCGLFRSDADLEARIISIGRSAYQGHVQDSGKTENATRTVHISKRLADRIRQYTVSVQSSSQSLADNFKDVRLQKSLSWELPANSLLFPHPSREGKAHDNGQVVLRGLKPVIQAMEIDAEGTGLHAFRHFNKSLMLHLGVPEKYRCERQGHSTGAGKMDLIYTQADVVHHQMYAEMIAKELLGSTYALAMGAD